MRVKQETEVRRSRRVGQEAPKKRSFDTVSPRKTGYLMRQFNHISDKSDLFIKTCQ